MKVGCIIIARLDSGSTQYEEKIGKTRELFFIIDRLQAGERLVPRDIPLPTFLPRFPRARAPRRVGCARAWA